LLEAAIREFSEKGYERTTLAGIAARAGVTTGAIYNHFDGKLDLLVAAIGGRDVRDFWQTVAAAAALPWSEAAIAMSAGLSQRPDQRSLLLLDVIVLARRDPDAAARMRTVADTYLDAVARATEEGQAAGVIDPALSPTDLARLLAALVSGLLVLEALGLEPPSPPTFVQLIDFLLQSSQAEEVDEPAPLARVRTRSAVAERARARQRAAIVEAAGEGFSLRRIGAAAGLSHERVRTIVAEARSAAPHR
jgi:AcrR family transcriptional regulator